MLNISLLQKHGVEDVSNKHRGRSLKRFAFVILLALIGSFGFYSFTDSGNVQDAISSEVVNLKDNYLDSVCKKFEKGLRFLHT